MLVGTLTRVFRAEKMGIQRDTRMHLPAACYSFPSRSINHRRSEYFSRHYLMVFKPNRLVDVCSFQIDEVKAKRLFCPISYCTDRLDGAFQPSEGTITGHIDQTSDR